MANDWLIGALLAATGSICSNLGVNCQKYSFMQNAKLPKQLQKKHIRQKGWLFGMLLVVIGSIGDFAALSIAAQSIVAPIGSITLVANVVFAHYWLKEALSWVELLGTSMIVGGSILAVAFGDHQETSYDIYAILSFFYGTTFVIYAILSICLGVALYRFQKPITPIKQKIVDATKRYEIAYELNDRGAMEYEDFYISSLQVNYARYEKIHPFTLCALSGILGGQSVMFGKMVGELFSKTADGDNQLFSPFFYLFVILMICCVVGQLQYLAIALNYFDALYVVPVFQCFFISFSTLGGACFFNEFASFSVAQGLLFPIGLLCTLGGVVVLTRRKMSDGSDQRKKLIPEEEEEENIVEMERIEEGDEEAATEMEEEDRTKMAAEAQKLRQQEEEAKDKSALLLLQKRIRRAKRRRRKQKLKHGYTGLIDEDEQLPEDGMMNGELVSDEDIDMEDDDMFGRSSDEEISEVSQESPSALDVRSRYPAIAAILQQRKESEESKTSDEQPPTTIRANSHTPPQPRRSSLTYTPSTTSSHSTPPLTSSSPHHTPVPAIEDLMGAAAATLGGAALAPSPTAAGPGLDRRGSGGAAAPAAGTTIATSAAGTTAPSTAATASVERRQNTDRRTSLPRRQSRSPGPGLNISIEDSTTSGPSTPTSLSRQPTLFRQPTVSAATAPTFMQPSTQTYMPPPTGLDLFAKGEKVDEKIKKYSTVAYHAGGLVGVPLVSAIAHAVTIAKEERLEELREEAERKKQEEKKGEETHQAIQAAANAPATLSVATTGIGAAEDSPLNAQHSQNLELQPLPPKDHVIDITNDQQKTDSANDNNKNNNNNLTTADLSIPIPVAVPVTSSDTVALLPSDGPAAVPLSDADPSTSSNVRAGHPSASKAFIEKLKDKIVHVFVGDDKEKERKDSQPKDKEEQKSDTNNNNNTAGNVSISATTPLPAPTPTPTVTRATTTSIPSAPAASIQSTAQTTSTPTNQLNDTNSSNHPTRVDKSDVSSATTPTPNTATVEHLSVAPISLSGSTELPTSSPDPSSASLQRLSSLSEANDAERAAQAEAAEQEYELAAEESAALEESEEGQKSSLLSGQYEPSSTSSTLNQSDLLFNTAASDDDNDDEDDTAM